MDNRRKFTRLPVQLSARYSNADEEEWKECAVINISHEGMCVGVYAQDKIEMYTILQL